MIDKIVSAVNEPKTLLAVIDCRIKRDQTYLTTVMKYYKSIIGLQNNKGRNHFQYNG